MQHSQGGSWNGGQKGSSRSAGIPADQATVRRSNLSLVLRHVSERGSRSRSTVAAETGLNKTTVTSLVGELVARGLIKEIGPQHAGAVGRPGLALALDGSGVGALGTEVNVDYVAAFATDVAGRVLIDRRVGFDATGGGPERSLDELARTIKEAMAELDLLGVTLAGITVAVPGLIDSATGIVEVAPDLGWYGVPVAKVLVAGGCRTETCRSPWTTTPTSPHWRSSPPESRRAPPTSSYRRGEVGVGGGVIAGGRLLGGADGFAGEVGHVMVDPSGERCGCGRIGCSETKARPGGAGPDGHPGTRLRCRRRSGARPGGAAGRDRAATGRGRPPGRRGRHRGRSLARARRGHAGQPVQPAGDRHRRLLRQARRADDPRRADRAETTGYRPGSASASAPPIASDLGFGAASRGAAGIVVERVLSDPTSIDIRHVVTSRAGKER